MMRSTMRALVVAVGCMAGAVSGAHASVITYIFTGTGTGTLGGDSFDGAFTASYVADTTTVVASFQRFDNVVTSGTFSAGMIGAAFTGTNRITLTTDPAFTSIGFGQFRPAPVFFSAEALLNSSLGSYDLASARALTVGAVSFLPQTFGTAGGDLSFTAISSLNFEATVASAAPEPSTWAMMLAGFASLGLLVLRRDKRLKASAA